MAGFPTAERQKIVDDYLNTTGRNLFVPGEFIDWLAEHPDHLAYDWFFSDTDEEAARQHRISLARRMVSGLRISAKVSEAPSKSKPVSVKVHEYPAMVSAVAGRRSGGGYTPFDPQDEAARAELRAQGATALRAWLTRYEGVAVVQGVDVSPIKEIVSQMSGDVAKAG